MIIICVVLWTCFTLTVGYYFGYHMRRLETQYPDDAVEHDDCQLCHGTRGGVPGNEQIVPIAGLDITVCDYCHAALSPSEHLSQSDPA